MMITAHTWEPLEATSVVEGSARLRLHPDGPQDIFLAVAHPGVRRRLLLERPDAAFLDIGLLPQTRAVRVMTAPAGVGRSALIVELVDRHLAAVFDPLVSDIADSVAPLREPDLAAERLIERFDYWVNLLKELENGSLGPLRRRGLFGELFCLRKLFMPVLAPGDAVRGWTGPTATNQDFQYDAGAVEIKTTAAKQPQTLIITNERELDSTGTGVLLLVRVSIDERRGGSGESLNDQVASVRKELADPGAAGLLDELISRYGYLPQHVTEYDEPRYTVRALQAWQVRDDFPRVVESDLRSGVGDVRYRIVTSGLERFEVPLVEVPEIITGRKA
jgi:hypothetical protein